MLNVNHLKYRDNASRTHQFLSVFVTFSTHDPQHDTALDSRAVKPQNKFLQNNPIAMA